MPTYIYACPRCGGRFDRSMPLSDRNHPQICNCGEVAKKIIGEGPSFIAKGDGWVGKNIRIQGQMEDKNRHLSNKSRDLPSSRLVPNVGGEEVSSWGEAKRLAASSGKDISGYESLVQKENAA